MMINSGAFAFNFILESEKRKPSKISATTVCVVWFDWYNYCNMMKLLSLILSLLLQGYQSADTSKTAANILLSNENANSFLQTKNRNRRGLHEGLREECCYENCFFEERADIS